MSSLITSCEFWSITIPFSMTVFSCVRDISMAETVWNRNQYRLVRDHGMNTRYFIQLVAILWVIGLGFPASILLSIQYGPLAVLGTVLVFLGFFAWKNEARKTGRIQYDDRKPMRLEEYLKLVGGENVEEKE